MAHMYDWGDLRFFLATARNGSTLAAARELGVNQTTIARRIAALETALSIRLVDRNRDGYRLTEAGVDILAQAERVASEAETVERLVEQRKRDLAGVIRVTATEEFADVILTPWLAAFIDIYPDIKVEVIATERRLDLGRGEADIAIRATQQPREPGILVRKLADSRWGLYCSRAYAAKHGAPACAADLNDHLVIGADGNLATIDAFIWLGKAAPRARVRTVCSTISNMLVAVRTGHGVGALPRDIGIAQKDFIACFAMPDFNYGWYLITREALKDVPRVKAFNKFIIAHASTLKRLQRKRP
jgi:DNA-binding transcriptional LysR family regulator